MRPCSTRQQRRVTTGPAAARAPFDDFYGRPSSRFPTSRTPPSGLGSRRRHGTVECAGRTSLTPRPDHAGGCFARDARVARRRFADEPERFELRVLDYAREPSLESTSGHIRALYPSPRRAGKRELFRKIYGVLCAGGVFMNADQVLGSTPEIEARYRETWLRQVRERGVGEEDLAAALVRMREDKASTLEEQTAWLEEAGFRQVDCPYKNYSFAVYGGRKQV